QSVAKGADIAGAVVAPGGELERVLVHVDDVTTQGNTEGVLTRQAKRSVPVLLLGLQADGQVKRLGDFVLPKEPIVTIMPRRRRELSVERRRRRQRDTRERKHARESQCERLSHFANSPSLLVVVFLDRKPSGGVRDESVLVSFLPCSSVRLP